MKFVPLAVISFGLFLAGCGPYSFSSSGLGSYRTIAIPLFDNQTAEFGLREALTAGITQGFVQDNNLKVTGEAGADLVLSGSITRYERVPYTFDRAEQVKEYIVRIWAAVTCTGTKEQKTVWEEKNLLGFGIYSATSESEADGRTRAITKLGQDIVNRTVRTW